MDSLGLLTYLVSHERGYVRLLEISIKLNISMQELIMGLVLAVGTPHWGAPNADAPELH